MFLWTIFSKEKVDASEPSPEMGWGSLLTSLAICVGGMSLAFWLHYELKPDYERLSEISLHTGIAFLVAAILIGTLEFNARRGTHNEIRRFLDQVSRDVFKALLGRMVPHQVFDEINDILHSHVVRRNCQYRITFKNSSSELPPDYIILCRDVMFDVESLLSVETIYDVKSSHSSDEDLASAAWSAMDRNFHLWMEVDGKKIPLEKDVNVFVQSDGTTLLKQQIKLFPRKTVHVALHGEEPCRIAAGRNTYLQAAPVVNLQVEIINDYAETIDVVGVRMNHPAATEMFQDGWGRYVLNRAFLPGQGFQILWKKVQNPDRSVTTKASALDEKNFDSSSTRPAPPRNVVAEPKAAAQPSRVGRWLNRVRTLWTGKNGK